MRRCRKAKRACLIRSESSGEAAFVASPTATSFPSSSFASSFASVGAATAPTLPMNLKHLKGTLTLPRLPGMAGGSPEAKLSRTWGGGSGGFLMSASDPMLTMAGGTSTGSRAPPPGSRQGAQFAKSASLTLLPIALPKDPVDRCYQQLVDRDCGPGPAAQWSLGHDARYGCKLDDMRMVRKLWDCYEVGFRGRKRQPPTEEELTYGIFDPRMQTIKTATADKTAPDKMGEFPNAWCDACGQDIGDEYLWFCRRCKSKGNRFELCPECHGIEVMQAEGKHNGRSPHPHLLRCEHRGLVKHRNLRTAYPGLPHLRCLLCDICGSYIPGLAGGDDRVCVSGPHVNILSTKRAAESADQGARREGGRALWKAPGSGDAFTCPRCPEEVGLRFEVCENCAHSLLDVSSGIQRLSTLF
mmetsp:Transcript_74839/g.243040  ORF Transcript_74839/g.243040 Transcript_74839/m.243040 type:complete len:413 (+) Transcript_74839:1638-2876(+)